MIRTVPSSLLTLAGPPSSEFVVFFPLLLLCVANSGVGGELHDS